jgi:predicted dehydrogenase
MKILIAGFGSIGRRHFRNLRALGVDDFIFLRSGRSTLPDDEIAAYPAETEIQAALAHRPDAVVVANPTALHLDVAIPAARAGCHLFLEKPLSHSHDDVDELRDAVAAGGGQVLVGFQFRYHPGLARIRGWLNPSGNGGQSSAIGRPLSARAHWGEYLPNWHPWEDYRKGYSARRDLGGGVVLTLCHPLDYLRWLLGEVSGLWAFTGRESDLGLEVEDTAEIGLRFANGVLGTVHLDYNQRPPSHHLEIIGTQGTIYWDNKDGAARLWRADTAEWEIFSPPDGFERNDLFRAQMRHFLAMIRGGEAPRCTLGDGIHALDLALAVYQSASSGQMVAWKQEL